MVWGAQSAHADVPHGLGAHADRDMGTHIQELSCVTSVSSKAGVGARYKKVDQGGFSVHAVCAAQTEVRSTRTMKCTPTCMQAIKPAGIVQWAAEGSLLRTGG